VQLDVTDVASVRAALAVIAEREGHLDVLVNNAGISTIAEVDGAEALKLFDTNVIGVIRVTPSRTAAAREVRQSGRGQRL